jgi:hypothetical protein
MTETLLWEQSDTLYVEPEAGEPAVASEPTQVQPTPVEAPVEVISAPAPSPPTPSQIAPSGFAITVVGTANVPELVRTVEVPVPTPAPTPVQTTVPTPVPTPTTAPTPSQPAAEKKFPWGLVLLGIIAGMMFGGGGER